MAQETTLQHSNPRGAESAVRRRLDDFLGTLDADELAELRASHNPNDIKDLEKDDLALQVVRQSAAAIAIARSRDASPELTQVVTGGLDTMTQRIFPEHNDEQRLAYLEAAAKGIGVPVEAVEKAMSDIFETNTQQYQEIQRLRAAERRQDEQITTGTEAIIAGDPNLLELLDLHFGRIPAFHEVIQKAKIEALKAARENETQDHLAERARAIAQGAVNINIVPTKDPLEVAVQELSAPDSPALGTRIGPVRSFVNIVLGRTGDVQTHKAT